MFFAARQPILHADQTLFAYELLFREGLENVFPDIDADQATSRMVEGLQSTLDLPRLTQDKPAFINFTHDSLLNGYPMMLSQDQIVVEILETARPTRRLLDSVKELKERGYQIALDDYEHDSVWAHFFPYIDIIKVDVMVTDEDTIRQIIHDIRLFPQIKLLAEKVETHDQFQRMISLGFSYFQGYFFSRPEVMQSKRLDHSSMALTNLVVQLSKNSVAVDDVLKVFEGDANLSFKLLRYVNSPLFRRRNEIQTIRQAIVVLGEQELKRFVYLLFSASVGESKPAELSNMSLVRARFGELLMSARAMDSQAESAFLVGLLSTLDAMLNTSMEELLQSLALVDDMKNALLHGTGIMGESLQLVQALEQANWTKVMNMEQRLGLADELAKKLYLESLEWAAERQKASAAV